MRHTILLFLFIIVSLMSMNAQRTITGKVTDADGEELPGVTVLAKGTSAATITNLMGDFSLVVGDSVEVIVFKFVGYSDQELPISNVMNVIMAETTELEEIVVTAIGVEKSEKSVAYAITSVDGDEVTRSGDRSALNSLQGKIAGVTITSASGAPGSSSRVIFRGFSSFSQSNQPLFVVDGVPINNVENSNTSLNGGTDFGNGVNDIDPNIIESVNFFKGSAATALYGSRAANGVIVITTKNGAGKKGTNITINSSVKFSTPLRIPQLQNLYGQGIFGNWDQRENTSYGPKFDDELHYWGHNVNGERLIKPYSALPNNVSDFFEVGKTYNNSVSLAGGSESATYFLSLSNVTDDGIMPYDRDTYSRNTVSFSGTSKIASWITSEASINYVNKKNRFVPTGQGGQSVWNNVLQQPRDIPVLELANYKEKFYDYDTYYSPYTTNPYWPLLENGNNNNEDRVFGRVEVNINPIEALSFKARVGTDVSNRQLKEWRAIKVNSSALDGGFNFDVDPEYGLVHVYKNWTSQINSDLIANYSNKFGDFGVNILVGHNLNQESYKSQSTVIYELSVPGFYDLSNTSGAPDINEHNEIKRLIGVYGSAEIRYKTFLTLTLSDRNDWSSTLPKENNSFNYPSVGVAFVYTDILPVLKKYIPYGKLRVNWGQTGNDASVYAVYPVFAQPGRFPLPSQVNAFSVGNIVGNPELQPEITTEFEAGTDIRFFNNRVQIDFAYYNRIITDLIFLVDLSSTSGYAAQWMNLGKMQNKGVELGVSITPIEKDNFTWDIRYTFSRNRSKLIELNDQLEHVDIFGLLGGTEHWFRAYPGGSVGVFEGSKPEIYVDEQGVEHPVVDAQGIPTVAEEGYITYGKSENDYIMGLVSDITLFKNFMINFTIDYRQGGLMHSRTAGMVWFTGIAPQTLYNDRQPFIVPNSVIKVGTDGEGNPIYAENTIPVTYEVLGGSANSYFDRGGLSVGGHEMVSKTFIKLRSLSINYNIPTKYLKRLPFSSLSLGLVGNNLLLWTPRSNNIIDPELTTYGNDLEAEFGEFGATPSVRSMGFSLAIKF